MGLSPVKKSKGHRTAAPAQSAATNELVSDGKMTAWEFKCV
jgi:hypothetical protein